MALRNRWNCSGYPYFVTTAVIQWAVAFKGNPYFDILCDSLIFCTNKYNSKLLAYCLMPNHIHLVLWPNQNAAISDFMRDFKKFTSVQIRKLLEKDGEMELLNTFRLNATGAKGQVFKLWKDRFDDLVLTKAETAVTKINYIHENPVRKGLVSRPEDWFYSSARDYLAIGTSAVPVDMDWW
ncbi:MAG: hypothetical protein A2X87_08300 [Deltaproteobacteria bacterium GWC2_42_51]|nr:MAG: hypothetical protein A2056_00590 [Deltaproteobacteria bacterium GWA2_42_85]OGP23047.1 MAG: hypothetical protein A2067_08990 [Deltaproteobacteria bacterium GWB2_42_7]OGP34418.1 MAG: hypothetical protein A2X87_08300 [Deltaproteobacteria bacterium GWC2_42_51]OGP41244.1 MAG: hypothetical protein A2090_08645 [Deltaproteobacteria bacterium GWD2_42_10]OGQ25068.1 MAG: hypothetical protein A3D29_05175 [Deltaproteobacteria bacterium RIFCSPHIGHO2_02_FULL_42_44]OGQ36789.1 MAG: hypothetical protein